MEVLSKNKKALSIIEVMVGIFIFTLGISAIYMVISSTVSINTYNKNFLIASNLAREQIELIRNTRDTNYKKFQKWNMIDPHSTNYSNGFIGSTSYVYKMENRFQGTTEFPIITSQEPGIPDFKSALKDIGDTTEDKFRLCLDANKRYVYCSGVPGEKLTPFYRYIEVQDLEEDALKVRSRVFWNQKGVHDTGISTILADWKRL